SRVAGSGDDGAVWNGRLSHAGEAVGDVCADSVGTGIALESPVRARASDAAFGTRLTGSFSSSDITAAARSCGQSGRSCDSGAGRSVMCFMSIDAVLPAWNGSRPASI